MFFKNEQEMFKLIEEKLYTVVCCGLVAVSEKLEEEILQPL